MCILFYLSTKYFRLLTVLCRSSLIRAHINRRSSSCFWMWKLHCLYYFSLPFMRNWILFWFCFSDCCSNARDYPERKIHCAPGWFALSRLVLLDLNGVFLVSSYKMLFVYSFLPFILIPHTCDSTAVMVFFQLQLKHCFSFYSCICWCENKYCSHFHNGKYWGQLYNPVCTITIIVVFSFH